MSIQLYPSIAKIKRNGVYENLPGFVPETGAVATQQMIATSESSATAQYVHNKGEYFRLNDTLYQAIVKINVGDAIVVGTNCEVAVIGNDLTHVANSIAAYELGIATSSHNTGDYFMVGETLYVATADIQVGDTISTSTNCRLAVVGDELSGLKTAITQETGRNLFNVDEAVDGYIDSSGNIAVYGDWKTTGFIPVSGLKSIIASSVTGTSGNRSFNPLYFLNTYRADKTRIGKVWDSCTNGKYTIGENVGYIRFSYHNYAWDVDLMVESGEIFHRYRPYEKFNAFNNSPYLDEKELVKSKEELDIVCWGDSLTFSQYSTNTTYPQKLSELITKTNRVHNFGVPGETSLAVATRQGAYPFNMPPCTIPASGYVVVTPSDVFGNEFTTLFHNAMRDGQLDLPSQLTVNGKSYGVGYEGNNQYRIVNIGTGNEEMTLPHGAVAEMFGELYRNSIPVFWAGTNDSPTTADDAEHITKIIRSMANHSNRDEYLVLGLTVKSYADTVNASLAYEFGQHYVDVKSYLINYGLDINNLTPTEQDTTDIANGVVPTSLRYDSVHFNDYGYIAVATCVYEAGKDLGYWE